jgi:hypothetical protein
LSSARSRRTISGRSWRAAARADCASTTVPTTSMPRSAASRGRRLAPGESDPAIRTWTASLKSSPSGPLCRLVASALFRSRAVET